MSELTRNRLSILCRLEFIGQMLARDASNRFAPGSKSIHRGSVKDLGIDTASSRDIMIRDALQVSLHEFVIGTILAISE
jgi:hypothetical protein